MVHRLVINSSVVLEEFPKYMCLLYQNINSIKRAVRQVSQVETLNLTSILFILSQELLCMFVVTMHNYQYNFVIGTLDLKASHSVAIRHQLLCVSL